MEEAPRPNASDIASREKPHQWFPFTLSAHTKQALSELQKKFEERLKEDNFELEDLSYTLASRRSHYPYRLSTVASSREELVRELSKAKITKVPDTEEEKKVCFVFTGQGAQWYAMGRQLMRDEPVFLEYMKGINCTIGKLENIMSVCNSYFFFQCRMRANH